MDFKAQLQQARLDGILEGYKKVFREYTYQSILNGEYMDKESQIASEKLLAYNSKKNLVTNWFWTINFKKDIYLPDLLETLQNYLYRNKIFNRFQLVFELKNENFHIHLLSNADTHRGKKYYINHAYKNFQNYILDKNCIDIKKIKKLDVRQTVDYLHKKNKNSEHKYNEKMRKIYKLKSIYIYPDKIYEPTCCAKIRV